MLLTPRQSFASQNFDTPLGKGVTPPSQENDLIGGVITQANIKEKLEESCRGMNIRKALLIPPDITRAHSGAGPITKMYYDILTQKGATVNILPALGTHAPMTRDEQTSLFGNIPEELFLEHRWRDGVTTLGGIPSDFVHEMSEGFLDKMIPVQVSDYLMDTSYDLIISIGQVVPHEVVGMANYTKNIVVGCGGAEFISASHMVGAFYGIERTLGEVNTPVRRLFDYAEENFLKSLPIMYVMTVMDSDAVAGLFIGRDRKLFEDAAALSCKRNITYVERPIKYCVTYLDEANFHSFWIGNKAIYRTRMAMADGGDLIVLAPGLRAFGEDTENDRIIQKYGYIGRERILELLKTEADLQNNLSAAAHLIHGSSDRRFNIIYAAPHMGKSAVEKVGYSYMEWGDAVKKQSEHGVYFIQNPAAGLWKADVTGA